MQLYPALQVKKLKETTAGELICIRWSKTSLAIVGFEQDHRFIVFLDPDGLHYIFADASVDLDVISYGKDWICEVTNDFAYMDIRANNYYDAIGGIELRPNQRSLRVKGAGGHFPRDISFDLETASITERTVPPHAILGAWEIKLPPSPHSPLEKRPTLFSHRLSKLV